MLMLILLVNVVLNSLCSSDTSRNLLHELDLEGAARRRLRRRAYSSKGALCCVHVDGYDKLKTFGFATHNAICGLVLPCLI